MILWNTVKIFPLGAVFFLVAGCNTIETKPFEKFNASLMELDKGATSTLDITIPMAESRYRNELAYDIIQGSDALLNELAVVAKQNDPFYISKPPVFLEAKKFKMAISKTNLVWLEYSKLLLQLSSKELVDEEKFSKMSEKLNENAFDAVQSLKEDPSDTSAKNTALFSEIAITLSKEYIKTKKKYKLMEAITNNQESIKNYVKHMQSAIVTMAQSSTQEHSEKQQALNRNLILLVNDNENDKNNARIQKVMSDMIEVKSSHTEQMTSLQALYTAYGKIPEAHEALSKRLAKSDSSVAAISDLLEKGIQLHTSYEAKAKVNKAELVQAKADSANSAATVTEFRYQQAELKASQAQFEFTLAQNASNEDPDNEAKIKDAEDKKTVAEELRIEADKLKESAVSLRASATAVQESANEVKSSIINY